MYKVVYNDCYGGFELSEKAWEMLQLEAPELTELAWILNSLPRHDPRLVGVVEKLGTKAASGPYSKLVIRELAEDKYYILEFQGRERVITPNTLEWIHAV